MPRHEGRYMKEKRFDFGEFLLAAIKCAGYYGVYTLAAIACYAVFGAIIGLSGAIEETEALIEKNAITLSLMANALFLLIVAVFYNNKSHYSSFGERLKTEPLHPKAVTYIFSLAICAIMAVQIVDVIPFPTKWVEMAYKNGDMIISASPAIQILTVAVMAPLTEEVLFRGLMLGALSKTCNKWVAIIATAIVFGAVHGHPIGIIYASCLGVLLGWIYIKTGSIIAPILFHTVYNFASLFFPVPNSVLTVIVIAVIGFAIGAVCVVNMARLPAVKKKTQNKDDGDSSTGLQ